MKIASKSMTSSNNEHKRQQIKTWVVLRKGSFVHQECGDETYVNKTVRICIKNIISWFLFHILNKETYKTFILSFTSFCYKQTFCV